MVTPCINCGDTGKREYCSEPEYECDTMEQTACTYCGYCQECNKLLIHTNGDNPNRKAGW